MLVLSRKLGESVYIGDEIRITVVEIRGDKIRLGFEAPDEVSVHRHEVWMAIQQEKVKGVASEPPQPPALHPGEDRT